MTTGFKKRRGISEIRLNMPITQLVNEMGVSERTINRWFNGEYRIKLNLRQLETLLKATNKTLPELIEIFEPTDRD